MSDYKEDIVKLRKKNKSYSEIEEILGCSKGTISYHCKNEGLEDIGTKYSEISEEKKKKIKEYRKKHTSTETAQKFNVSRSTVEKYADDNNKFEKDTLEGDIRTCRFCERNFKYKRETGHRKNCCNSCYTKIRRVRNKLKAIKFLGGECEKCGYNKHPSALEFHHTGEKNITIGAVVNKSWENIVKPELERCKLLCSNCHRVEHSKRFSDGFINKMIEDGKLEIEKFRDLLP